VSLVRRRSPTFSRVQASLIRQFDAVKNRIVEMIDVLWLAGVDAA
jgi:hypothetical protein